MQAAPRLVQFAVLTTVAEPPPLQPVHQRQQLANNFISYGTQTLGFSPRLGFALREDMSLQLRYSIYQQKISLPNNLANCNNNSGNGLLAVNPSPHLRI